MTDLKRKLAEAIARELFTNGCAERAQRLVLTIDKPTSRDLGGWSEQGAVECILKVLARAEAERG